MSRYKVTTVEPRARGGIQTCRLAAALSALTIYGIEAVNAEMKHRHQILFQTVSISYMSITLSEARLLVAQ